MPKTTLTVTGMACGGCEQNVESSLDDLDGVTDAQADHETDTVEVTTSDAVSDETIRATIEDAGYEVAG